MLTASPTTTDAASSSMLESRFHRSARRALSYRRLLMMLNHIGLFLLSTWAAFLLRFDGAIPAEQAAVMLATLPLLVLLRAVAFLGYRLYEDVWRHASVWDVLNIVRATLVSSAAFFVIAHLLLRHTAYPRSIILIDALVLIFLSSAARLSRRMLHYRTTAHCRRVLIFGAGDAGEVVARELKKNAHHGYRPVGFVDDDPEKIGSRIHGVPVLGGRAALEDIVRKSAPDEILVAIPRAAPATIRSIVQTLEPFRLPFKTVPALEDIVAGRAGLSEIRTLAIEDLLVRPPVSFDLQRLRSLVSRRRVLVTGAAGSIGSELCRQIARLLPSTLVLFERHEAGLWEIDYDLRQQQPGELKVEAVVGDVTDREQVGRLFARYHPDLVFHAAAHKHVPLMESHPCEAAKNNILGTVTVASVALQSDVDRLVFISTDKAVNPSSVMGATKRVAELAVQELAAQAKREFLCVRFGNVLGSSGSVVPLFLKQIEAGGPVTVTHPEVRRYFMLLSEAVHLVLHAAALGGCGALYVLEMGEQVRILEMARNLIRLAGHIPGREIPIAFTGLRPGEKLSEELTEREERLEPSEVSKILRVAVNSSGPRILDRIPTFEKLIAEGSNESLLALLDEIFPHFHATRAGTAPSAAA
jgi:FlaA1/EpsC-like NDP-sugar epimerase